MHFPLTGYSLHKGMPNGVTNVPSVTIFSSIFDMPSPLMASEEDYPFSDDEAFDDDLDEFEEEDYEDYESYDDFDDDFDDDEEYFDDSYEDDEDLDEDEY